MNDYSPPPRRFLPIGLFIVLAFLLGVFLDREGWLPGGPDREPADARPTFGPFWEAWNLVHQHYVDQKSVDSVKMTRFAIAGMLDSLGDEGHTGYLSPEDVQQENNVLQGEMEGIGAVITMRDHIPTIRVTMPDSPARKAGLKAGDVLLKVNDESVAHLSLLQIVQKVRGPAGSEVKLSLHRDAQAEPTDVTITRGKVAVPDVTWHMLPGEPYAHIEIVSFGAKADEQLRAKLKEARDQGAKGAILDLRGNPGGLRDQAVSVTSEFLKDGDVFIEENVRGVQTPVPVIEGGAATDFPLCVLIDGGTASAAEICAGALQDHDRAKLVGTRTFGTGTVLQPFPLSDGSEIHLAILKWLTPKKQEIWHHGIDPNVEVALPDGASDLMPEMEEGVDPSEFKKTEDVQLLKALSVLREQVEGKAETGK